VVTAEAAAAMSGALARVAALNHVPQERFSFRHGSIATRRRRLVGLVGQPVDGLPIDRRANVSKLLSVLGLVLAIGGLVVLGRGG
jgi:hypothetical protein